MKDINYKELVVNDKGDFDLIDDNVLIQQTSDIIINSDKGQNYINLLKGVGIVKYLNGPTDSLLVAVNSDIRTELGKDNLILQSFNVVTQSDGGDNDNNITIKVKRK